VGFLGAYTTYSTFSYETFTLFRADRTTAAVLYIAVSLAGGLTSAALGYLVARRLG
jgi:CrcB protein